MVRTYRLLCDVVPIKGSPSFREVRFTTSTNLATTFSSTPYVKLSLLGFSTLTLPVLAKFLPLAIEPAPMITMVSLKNLHLVLLARMVCILPMTNIES